jgi:hypothetical protein
MSDEECGCYPCACCGIVCGLETPNISEESIVWKICFAIAEKFFWNGQRWLSKKLCLYPFIGFFPTLILKLPFSIIQIVFGIVWMFLIGIPLSLCNPVPIWTSWIIIDSGFLSLGYSVMNICTLSCCGFGAELVVKDLKSIFFR